MRDAGLRPHHLHRRAPPASTATSARRTTRWRSSASYGFAQTLAARGQEAERPRQHDRADRRLAHDRDRAAQGAARRAQARVRLAARRLARARDAARRPAASSRSAAASSRSCAGSAPTGKTFKLGRDDHARGRRQRRGRQITELRRRPTHPGDVTESMQPIMANVEAGPSKGGNEFIDVDAALGYEYPELRRRRTTSATSSLYALGVGAGAGSDRRRATSQLVYEMRGKGFKALPTLRRRPRDQRWCSSMAKQGEHRARASTTASTACSTASSTPRCKRPLPPHAQADAQGDGQGHLRQGQERASSSPSSSTLRRDTATS